MDEAGRVLARLTRIEKLRDAGNDRVDECGSGPTPALLAELRALVPEAEAWARRVFGE